MAMKVPWPRRPITILAIGLVLLAASAMGVGTAQPAEAPTPPPAQEPAAVVCCGDCADCDQATDLGGCPVLCFGVTALSVGSKSHAARRPGEPYRRHGDIWRHRVGRPDPRPPKLRPFA